MAVALDILGGLSIIVVLCVGVYFIATRVSITKPEPPKSAPRKDTDQ